MKQRETHNATTQISTRIHTKGGLLVLTTETKVKHNQKDTTNGAKRVRIEGYKEMAFNSVVRVMRASERAEKQRNDRRAKRNK
jgi:biopolymer transport protein ExbD